MKSAFKFFALSLLAGTMFAACGDDDSDGPGEPGKPGGPEIPVEITSDVKGAVKAGIADAIEITGSGFDSEQDYVYIGYDKDGEAVYERIPADVLTIRSSRISFGVNVGANYLDKTVKVYLDRPGFDRMAISDDITFTLPSVEEGYIPDVALRSVLADANRNPNVVFSPLGLLDVNNAATMTDNGKGYALDISDCAATSLEGIELFKNVTGLVPAWGMPNIKEIDLSKWEAKGIEFFCERANSLEKFVGPPYAYRIRTYDSPKLTHVDVHNCDWLRWLEISNFETGGGIDAPNSAVTYLDIRRNQSGTYADKPTKVGEMAMVWNNANQGFNVADNATILIDSHFLYEHTLEGAWTPIYKAWKERGATIKVYSTIDPHRDELLGTVPSAEEMPDALVNANKNGDGSPANKWQVDDPYTDKNEAPGNK